MVKKKTEKKVTEPKIVDRAGNVRVVDCGVGRYALAMSRQTEHFSDFLNWEGFDWDSDPVSVGGVRTVPWGPRDNMPQQIRDLLEKNNIGPGIIARKLGLIYGQGPELYRTVYNGGEPEREWVEDENVAAWLRTWNYREYTRNALNEYLHMNGHFTRYVMTKSVRVGKPRIARLDCLPTKDCRLVWPGNAEGYLQNPMMQDVRQVLVGDIARSRALRLFPIWDGQPDDHEAYVGYHRLGSFGRTLYSICSFHGSLPWLENANDISDIVRILNENMIAAAYIVHEPAEYWERKRIQLMEDHDDWGPGRVNQELEKMREDITKKLAEVMAGKRNAGKFFTCIDFNDDRGNKQEWKVEPIDMNIDKYISAQQKISKIADSASTSGFGLAASLSNIIIDGKSDSGSQMLYAVKLFFAADTQVAEDIVLEALNNALHLNFPGKRDLQFGFYHKIIQKEDNVSAGERAINNV